MDAGQAHDVDHALEFLERYVGRKLFSNPALRAALSEELKEAQGQNMKAEGDKETALVHAHRYAFPADGVARTGDIVEVLSSPEGKLLMIAAVLTPACDLDTAKCVELRLVVAEERAGDAKGYSEALLPAVRGPSDTVYRHFIVQFHRTFFAKDVSVGQTPQARGGKVIHYDHDFEDALGHKLRLRPVCRLDDPYRADLLQKYASHASRVGIP
jgi:hypothetical protein